MDLLSAILEDSSTKAYLSEYPSSEWTTVIRRMLAYGISSIKALGNAGFPVGNLPIHENTYKSVSLKKSNRNTPREKHYHHSNKRHRSKLNQSIKIQKKHRSRHSNNKENKVPKFVSPDSEVRTTAEFITSQPFQVKNLIDVLPEDIPRRLNPVELKLETDCEVSS